MAVEPRKLNVVVERVEPAILETWDVTLNSNNHPKDPADAEIAHLSYKEEISKTHLSRYKDVLPYPVAWEYRFETREIRRLREAARTGILRGLVSESTWEDLEPTVARLQSAWRDVPEGYFYRFDGASPKDGHRAFPARTASQVILALVTSRRALRAMDDGQTVLYFVRFEPNWDETREFRVFVRQGRVTAISQYSPWREGVLSTTSDHDAIRWTENAVSQLENLVLPSLMESCGTRDMVCDVYATEINDSSRPNSVVSLSETAKETPRDETKCVRVVELNSFGYWLASGSALFHWITDKDLLYGKDETRVVLRVVRHVKVSD